VATPTSSSTTTTTGSLWNRLKAAKEVINATITGEEKWPGKKKISLYFIFFFAWFWFWFY
jgi:hypothetical protein